MEAIANDAFGTLTNSISDSDTSFSVAPITRFPVVGPYTIRVGDEYMLCSGRGLTNLDVTRGQEGSTAIAHSAGASVKLVLSAASMRRLFIDYVDVVSNDTTSLNEGSTLYNPLLDLSVVKKSGDNFRDTKKIGTDGVWQLFNSTNVARVDSIGDVTSIQNSGTNSQIAWLNKTGADISSDVRLRMTFLGPNCTGGFVWHESSSGKFVVVEYVNTGTLRIQKYDDLNTLNSSYVSVAVNLGHELRLVVRSGNDGTRKVWYSVDGLYWYLFHSVSSTDFIDADEIGVFSRGNVAGNKVCCLAWTEIGVFVPV